MAIPFIILAGVIPLLLLVVFLFIFYAFRRKRTLAASKPRQSSNKSASTSAASSAKKGTTTQKHEGISQRKKNVVPRSNPQVLSSTEAVEDSSNMLELLKAKSSQISLKETARLKPSKRQQREESVSVSKASSSSPIENIPEIPNDELDDENTYEEKSEYVTITRKTQKKKPTNSGEEEKRSELKRSKPFYKDEVMQKPEQPPKGRRRKGNDQTSNPSFAADMNSPSIQDTQQPSSNEVESSVSTRSDHLEKSQTDDFRKRSETTSDSNHLHRNQRKNNNNNNNNNNNSHSTGVRKSNPSAPGIRDKLEVNPPTFAQAYEQASLDEILDSITSSYISNTPIVIRETP